MPCPLLSHLLTTPDPSNSNSHIPIDNPIIRNQSSGSAIPNAESTGEAISDGTTGDDGETGKEPSDHSGDGGVHQSTSADILIYCPHALVPYPTKLCPILIRTSVIISSTTSRARPPGVIGMHPYLAPAKQNISRYHSTNGECTLSYQITHLNSPSTKKELAVDLFPSSSDGVPSAIGANQ
ncbi:hypothetical protein Tco_0690806 [Tanacetum coccineum]